MIKLSKRLQAVCDLVEAGSRVCDVGCDHAFVEIRLLQEGKIESALAMDVADGPLAKAKGNLELTELTDRCELRKSDGLAKFQPGEADTMICTGMGGILMRSILDAEPEKTASFRRLILSPQTEAALVREWLYRNNFHYLSEKLLMDEGKYYTIICVAPGGIGMKNGTEAGESSLVSQPSGRGNSVEPAEDGNRPDWQLLADAVHEMPEETLKKLNLERSSTERVLRDPGFRKLTENNYGPVILKSFIEGDPERPTESAEVFHQFLVDNLRSKLEIVRNLSEMPDSENAMDRLQEVSGEIGILQVLLASQKIWEMK